MVAVAVAMIRMPTQAGFFMVVPLAETPVRVPHPRSHRLKHNLRVCTHARLEVGPAARPE